MAKLGWRLVFLILTSQQLDIMHRSPKRVILTAAKHVVSVLHSSLLRNKTHSSAQYLIKNKLPAHGRLGFLILTSQQLDIMHRSPRRVILTAAKLNMWCQIYTHLFWEIKPPTSAQHLIKNKLAAHGRLALVIVTSQQLDIMHRSPRRVILTAAKLNMWCQFYTHLFWEIQPPTSAQHLIKNKLPATGGWRSS